MEADLDLITRRPPHAATNLSLAPPPVRALRQAIPPTSRPSRPARVEFGALSPSEAAPSELSASSVRFTSLRTVEADQLPEGVGVAVPGRRYASRTVEGEMVTVHPAR